MDFLKRSRPGVEGYDLPPLTQKLTDNNSNLLNQQQQQTVSSFSKHNFDTHVSKLENGLRVASEKLFGEFCTVGVIIDAGPRYESSFINGTTHFLEKLSFNVIDIFILFKHKDLSLNSCILFRKKNFLF
jgi:hypothetical protein